MTTPTTTTVTIAITTEAEVVDIQENETQVVVQNETIYENKTETCDWEKKYEIKEKLFDREISGQAVRQR